MGPEINVCKTCLQDLSRSGQTSLATAGMYFTKPVTNINFGPSIQSYPAVYAEEALAAFLIHRGVQGLPLSFVAENL